MKTNFKRKKSNVFGKSKKENILYCLWCVIFFNNIFFVKFQKIRVIFNYNTKILINKFLLCDSLL